MSPTTGPHIFDGDAQYLRKLHGHSYPGASDVGRPFHKTNGAIRVHAGRCAGWPSSIEPKPAGDSPAPIRPLQGRSIVLMLLGRLHRFQVAYPWEPDARDLSRALFRAVERAELQGIHTKLFAYLIYYRLCAKSGDGRPWRPVGSGLGLIQDHIVPLHTDVGDVIGSEDTKTAYTYGRTRKGSRVEGQVGFRQP